jgi:ligand-binding SRPBCC domain-containing protein
MPVVEITETHPCPPAVLFALLRRPAVLVALAPSDFGLTLLDGPDILDAGASYTVQARRWGLSQKVVTTLTECLPDESLTEEQTRGPFRRWRLTRRFRPIDGGTELTERVEFEPPGGMLGLTLTAARVEADLRAAFAERPARFADFIARAIDGSYDSW